MSENAVGAVLVVGGGVASVQASLDLANAGFQVYLLDPLPALAGHLSQLEQTFLTNDCDMCIMAPKVLEVSHHPAISVYHSSMLLDLAGDAGNLTARVRHTPSSDAEERTEELVIGAVILAPDYQNYNPTARPELGYGRYANVVTGSQFDRVLRTSGPVAWIQCVGSRDREHNYCSALCCLDATKKAMMAKQANPQIEPTIFIMDMRAFGKGYMDYYNQARNEFGVNYVRCRVASVSEDAATKQLTIRYETEAGELVEKEFGLVVLSTGIEVPPEAKELASRIGVELDQYGFTRTRPFSTVETSRPGVYVAGSLAQPKDMHDTVTQASAAAAKVGELLASARGTQVTPKLYPPERDVTQEEPRVGLFICDCGANIGKVVDLAAVEASAKTLPGVVYTEANLHACSPDTQCHLTDKIRELGLNRVVVASGTPLTHEKLFQETLREAGLNPYLLEMANIRDQVAWVHRRAPQAATEKAKELVRMAVARARLLEPLQTVEIAVQHAALIIGGGIAGLNSAQSLAAQGFDAYLVERESALGGNVRRIHHDLDGKDVGSYLRDLIAAVEANPRITVIKDATLAASAGFVGNFTSQVRTPEGLKTIRHGALIVTTGGQEYRGSDYGLGQHPAIITQLDLEERLAAQDAALKNAKEIVMIQCVGPAEQYCSRVCCSVALKHALQIKALNPATNVYILYKDLRAYSWRERYYTEAREQGIIFLRYDNDTLPQVSIPSNGENGSVTVQVREPLLQRDIRFTPDLLVLSEGMVPAAGTEALGDLLRVQVNKSGFFVEAHPKLQPVDFATDGLFVAGVAHAPKPIEETITQAHAVAARAATILSKDTLPVGGAIAVIEQNKCTGCLTCVRICPYHVPHIDAQARGAGNILGAAQIEAALCQGCGICVSECPAKAIQLLHYRDSQLLAPIVAMCEPEPAA